MNYSKNYKNFNLLEKKQPKKLSSDRNARVRNSEEITHNLDPKSFYKFVIIFSITVSLIVSSIYFILLKPANHKLEKLIESVDSETKNYAEVAKLQNEIGIKSQMIEAVLNGKTSDEKIVISILTKEELADFEPRSVVKESDGNYMLEFSFSNNQDVSYVSQFLKAQDTLKSVSTESLNIISDEQINVVFKIIIN